MELLRCDLCKKTEPGSIRAPYHQGSSQLTAERDHFKRELDERSEQRLAALADVERLTAERDALQLHYDAAGPEHNLMALLDLYHERESEALAELDAAAHGIAQVLDHDLGAEPKTLPELVEMVELELNAEHERATQAETELSLCNDRLAGLRRILAPVLELLQDADDNAQQLEAHGKYTSAEHDAREWRQQWAALKPNLRAELEKP